MPGLDLWLFTGWEGWDDIQSINLRILGWKMNNPFSISATVEIWKFIEPPVIKVSDLNVGGKTCYDTWGWFIDTTLRYSKEYHPLPANKCYSLWRVFLTSLSLSVSVSIIHSKTRVVWKTSNGKALKSRGQWGQEWNSVCVVVRFLTDLNTDFCHVIELHILQSELCTYLCNLPTIKTRP